MAVVKLTKSAIEAVVPGPKDVYLWDTELKRFGVRITKAGARIYLVQYRPARVSGSANIFRRITIGQHGKPWTIEAARKQARTILAEVDQKADPFADRRAELAARQLANQTAAAAQAEAERIAALRLRSTFEAVAKRFIETRLDTTRSGTETARLIKYDAIPAWRDRQVADIRRGDVAQLLDDVATRSPAVSRSVYAALRGLFAYAVERDLIEVSPCASVKAPPRPEARDRVLSDAELLTIWNGCDQISPIFAAAIRLLMLTGQRRSEVAEARWDEFDMTAAVWRIPKERSKNGREHELDLSPQAVAILEQQPRTTAFVFPARGEGPIKGFAATKRQLDAEIAKLRRQDEVQPMAGWRIHDLRRTFATGLAEMGLSPHVIERVLNHVSGVTSGLVGVYQRHEYRPERKAAMVAWGQRVDAIVKGSPVPSNVVELTTRRSS